MNWRNDEHLRDLVRIGNQLGMDAGISTARIIEAIQALKAEVKRSAEQELRWCKWIENLRVNWDGIYREPPRELGWDLSTTDQGPLHARTWQVISHRDPWPTLKQGLPG